MSVRGRWLATAFAALICSGATAQEPPAQEAPTQPVQAADSLPIWASGPMRAAGQEPPPGRVAARELGLAFTLPQSWQADDVSWRELDATAAKTINAIAESAVVVELATGEGESQALLTLYRVPLEQWRTAERAGNAGPGRITFTTAEQVYVVVRPPEATTAGRYATLRNALEDAIGTLALYDAFKEERHLQPSIGTDFIGTLSDGSAIKLHMDAGGVMTLTFGKDQRKLNARWSARDSQIIGDLLDHGDKINPTVLFHMDGSGLIAVKWDESLFGNLGVRLDKPQ